MDVLVYRAAGEGGKKEEEKKRKQGQATRSTAAMDPQSNSRLSSTAKRPPLVAFGAHLVRMPCPQESDCLAELNCRADSRRIPPKASGIRPRALGPLGSTAGLGCAMTGWMSA